MHKIFKQFGWLMLPVLTLLAVGCVEEEEYIDTHPRIASLEPNKGLPGTVVTLSGRNLQGVTSVLFGDVEAEVTSATAESLTVTVPETAEAGAQQLRVSSPQGVSVVGFEVQSPPTDNGPVFPTTMIFNDALDENWVVGGGWGGASSEAVIGNDPMEGAGSHNLVVSWEDPWGGFQVLPREPNPFTLENYSAIRISIKGGTGFEGKQVVLQVKGRDGKDYTDKPLVVTEEGYTTFVVPFSELGNPPSIEDIRLKNEVAGTVYVDLFGLE